MQRGNFSFLRKGCDRTTVQNMYNAMNRLNAWTWFNNPNEDSKVLNEKLNKIDSAVLSDGHSRASLISYVKEARWAHEDWNNYVVEKKKSTGL